MTGSFDRRRVTLWLDNQLPPALVPWMRTALSVDCIAVRDLKLQRAADLEIFHAARDARVVVMTSRSHREPAPASREIAVRME
jgi:predicted nuclease of predicted toxin-antitoxin system